MKDQRDSVTKKHRGKNLPSNPYPVPDEAEQKYAPSFRPVKTEPIQGCANEHERGTK